MNFLNTITKLIPKLQLQFAINNAVSPFILEKVEQIAVGVKTCMMKISTYVNGGTSEHGSKDCHTSNPKNAGHTWLEGHAYHVGVYGS